MILISISIIYVIKMPMCFSGIEPIVVFVERLHVMYRVIYPSAKTWMRSGYRSRSSNAAVTETMSATVMAMVMVTAKQTTDAMAQHHFCMANLAHRSLR